MVKDGSMKIDPREVFELAQKEMAAEQHRRAVEEMKQRIRERQARSWWKRLFPFTVKIERSN